MLLYNTLSRRKEEFKPLKAGEVGMYVCGPTVYDYNHIGHARTYLIFDLLRRFLEFQGNKVTFVQNITDVGHLVGDRESGEDKLEKKAREMDKTMAEVAEFYTKAHLKDLADLNIETPSVMPKASEHIPDIIRFITGLIEKGYAYVTDRGNVYFNVIKKADYGKLSRRTLTEILTGTRVESADDKKSVADFALWKAATHSMREFVWDSPWGKGYPGWHIECSVMSQKYLGDTFDIHGSAVEHIFPHHENEIAQTEALTGKPMANYWVYGGILTVGGTKMSKSLHNTVTIEQALKDYSANEIRLSLFLSPYRQPFDYTKQVMEQGKALRHKLFSAYEKAKDGEAKEYQTVIKDLENDLDTVGALAKWQKSLDDMNRADFEELFKIFGLKYVAANDNQKVVALIKERDNARDNKDFLTADNRKAEIVQLGYEVLDSADGSKYLPR